MPLITAPVPSDDLLSSSNNSWLVADASSVRTASVHGDSCSNLTITSRADTHCTPTFSRGSKGPVLTSGLLGRQLTVILVIKPAVGCHYFLPGPRLPSQLSSVITYWPLLIYTAWLTEVHACQLGSPCDSTMNRDRTTDLSMTSPMPDLFHQRHTPATYSQLK